MSEVKVQDYTNVMQSLPRLQKLPTLLPLEGAVRIELEEGVPVFRASDVIQARIEDLIMEQSSGELSAAEEAVLRPNYTEVSLH